MKFEEALKQLRKQKERKFKQSLDVIINLKGLDLRKENISAVITIPHLTKEKKVCGFLDKKSSHVSTITKLEFSKYKDKKALKNLVKDYDFFIASAPLMPSVATTFGKVLGPAGKMPSPQLGILSQETDEAIKSVLEKISKSIKIRVNEASVKVSAGNEGMKDEELSGNFKAIFKGILNTLPKKNENIKNVMIKFTMTKPIKIEA
jgi:large subunit ribosomal protein L1